MEDHGLRCRQLDEVDALEAIFGCEGEGCFSANEGEDEGMILLRSMLDSCAASPGDFDTQAPGIPQTISIRIERGQQGGERHTVRLTLPCKYPLEVAKCSVEWDAGTRAQRDYINGALSQFASSMAGEEMCYALASKAEELIEEEARDMEEARQVHAALSCCVDEGGFHHHGGRGGDALRMKRVLIFFHHIIAAGKREAVQQWAVELKLGGYSKIGWPGIIVAEGEEERCDTYIRSLKRLKWQHMEVRGEQHEDVPDGGSIDQLRRLHWGFEELGQDAMSVLAERCREAGLEDLFKTSLK